MHTTGARYYERQYSKYHSVKTFDLLAFITHILYSLLSILALTLKCYGDLNNEKIFHEKSCIVRSFETSCELIIITLHRKQYEVHL